MGPGGVLCKTEVQGCAAGQGMVFDLSVTNRVCIILRESVLNWIYVVVQFYPWFKFYFLLFQTHYHTLLLPKTKKKRKFKARIKLNHDLFNKWL